VKKLLIVIFILIVTTGCNSPNEKTTTMKEIKPEDVKIELSDEKIGEFWNWFSQHGDNIYNFNIKSSNQQLLGDIDKRLKSINSNLTFTIGPIKDGKRDFIISADGILTAFPYVKKLVDGAIYVDEFNIIAFRPRTELKEVQIGNVSLKYEQVFFKWEKENSGKISIDIYVKDYHVMNDDIESALFLLMDNAIGEYEVETKVGGISFNIYSENVKNLLPFSEFRKVIDENSK
jgi:hypothetical protein